MSKRELDAEISIERGARMASWWLHDLRRTFTTQTNEYDLIPPHMVEAIANHARKGMEGVYNRAKYIEQKRVGLQAWADWLEALVEGRQAPSNVVPLAG